ncbi:hypothetical protein imdm_1331 [gamma proteobacterium IMCC2047]|nr:hypothetical protein imdm_1331 [gamma proteobacterium IMCC2047]
MDIVTKLFLANLVGIISIAWLDKKVLKDKLEKLPGFGTLLEVWTLMTILTIPAWLVYFVVTL